MNTKRRGAAFIAAIIIALTATPMVDSPASARTVTGNAAAEIVDRLDPNRLGSLEIKFQADNPYDDLEPGQQPDLIQGRTYQIRLVENLDITDRANWSLIETISVDDIDNYELGNPITATTNAEGIARFENLEIGVYLVEDITPQREGYSDTRSAPFLVTVPIGDPDSGGWDYSVQIAPKNLPDEAESTVPPTPPVTTTPGTPTPGTSTPRTTVPEKPTKPRTPTTPREIPGNPTPEEPGKPSGPGILASTGASVLGIVGLGAVMLLIGFLLVRRRSQTD